MNISKIIKASVGGRSFIKTAHIGQEDYGIIFKIIDENLPPTYYIDFSNDRENGTSIPVLADENGAEIPEELISTGKDVYAFLYYVGDGYGKNLRVFQIPNERRPERGDITPTPAQQPIVDQLISKANEAITTAEQKAGEAGESARSASDDADRAERARTGAETAQGKAEEAQESAERAKDDAETSERNASESERKAKGYAETASEKADSIHSMTASAQTLPDGSSATASYNAETGVMSFGIPKGKDGTDGDDGYSPTANVSKSGKVATITITDKNGTTSAQVSDGTDGTDGIDGISPSVSVTDITGGHRVVITDKDGAKSFDVADGATGATPNLSIGTVETLEPTESATATITGTPENPVLNLGIPQGDAGEVTLADLNTALAEKAPIITDTASGAIASFTDGADDLPLKSLVVDINPIQDLHGQDSPYPAGGGKNKYSGASTVTVDNTLFTNVEVAPIPAGTYTISAVIGSEPTGYSGCRIAFRKADGSGIEAVNLPYTANTRRSVSFTLSDTCERIYFYYSATTAGTGNQTYTNVQIESGSTATDYAPYENICPISGWTEVDVEQSGVNVWDEEWELGTFNASGNPVASSGNVRTKNYIPIMPSTAYFFKVPSVGITAFYYDADKNFIEVFAVSSSQVKTTNENARYIKFRTGSLTTYNHDISINYPSTDHDYHPYTGRSITINLGQTVYGGKLNVLSGVMTVDRAIVVFNGTEKYLNNYFPTIVCAKAFPKGDDVGNSFVNSHLPSLNVACTYASGAKQTFQFGKANEYWGVSSADELKAIFAQQYANGTPVTICYPLAEPLEIQLTTNQVSSLLGVNNIWADSGDTTAEYRADTKMYIAKKIAEAISALS